MKFFKNYFILSMLYMARHWGVVFFSNHNMKRFEGLILKETFTNTFMYIWLQIHVRVSHRQPCAPWYRIILSVHVQSYIHVLTFYKKIEFHLYFDLYFSCDVLGVLEEEECKPGSSLGCLWLWGRGGLSLVERKITNKISEKLQLYHYQSVGLLTIVVEGICCTVKQLTFAFTIFCIFHDTVEWFCNYKLSWNHKDLSVWKFLELLTLYWLKFCFLKEIQRILKTKLHW